MKVLVAFESGDETQLFAVTGEAAEVALKSHRQYINTDTETNEGIHRLNEMFEQANPHPDVVPLDGKYPLSLEGYDKFVICGVVW